MNELRGRWVESQLSFLNRQPPFILGLPGSPGTVTELVPSQFFIQFTPELSLVTLYFFIKE